MWYAIFIPQLLWTTCALAVSASAAVLDSGYIHPCEDVKNKMNIHSRTCVFFGGCKGSDIRPIYENEEFVLLEEATNSFDHLYFLANFTFAQCSSHCQSMVAVQENIQNSSFSNKGKRKSLKKTGCYQLVKNHQSESCCFFFRAHHIPDEDDFYYSENSAKAEYNETLGRISMTIEQKSPSIVFLESSNHAYSVCCIEDELDDRFKCSDASSICSKINATNSICTFSQVVGGSYNINVCTTRNLDCVNHFDNCECSYSFYTTDRLASHVSSQDHLTIWVACIGCGVVVTCFLLFIWYIIRSSTCDKEIKNSTVPASGAAFQKPTPCQKILLVYPDDNLELKNTVTSLRKVVHCALNCEVYDIFDRKFRKQVNEEGALSWLLEKVREVDKVVLIETDVAHVLQFTQTKFCTVTMENECMRLFYQKIHEFTFDAESSKRFYVVRLEGFSPPLDEVSPIILKYKGEDEKIKNYKAFLPVRSVRYTLPQHLNNLLQDLAQGGSSCAVCTSNMYQDAAFRQLEDTLTTSIKDLALFKSSNGNYHEAIFRLQSH